MSYDDHGPDTETEVRGRTLWWRARCTCGWAADWTPDTDTAHDQFMGHIRQTLGLPAPPSPERCEECRGAGGPECHRCGGRGKVACGVCMGDPGEGIWSCTVCQGQGTEECGNCDGYGAERCSTCGKRGQGRRDMDFDLPGIAGGTGGSPVLTCLVLLLIAGIVVAVWQIAFR